LNLRDCGDGLEIRVEDGLLGVASLVVTMPIALRQRVECLLIVSGAVAKDKKLLTLVRLYCSAEETFAPRNRSAPY